MDIKKEGDKRFNEGVMDAALQKYEEANGLDPNAANEYALGNIGLVYLKKANYEKCIEETSKALEVISRFLNDT